VVTSKSIMYDTDIVRVGLVALLDQSPAAATTQRTLAETFGVSFNQLTYLLRSPDVRAAWDRAREQLRLERCATRRCNMCGVTKPASEFGVDRRDGCGIARRCKVCNRLSVKLYRQSKA